jgi:hypothetical protein
MRRLPNLIVALAVAASTLLLLPTSVVEAGLVESYFEVDPDSTTPGGTVTIDGLCVDDLNNWQAVFFYLDIVVPEPTGEEGTSISLGSFPITPGVLWSFEVTIPDDVEPQATRIGKQCARVNPDGSFSRGEATQRLPFQVVAPEESSTTTTSTTSASSETIAPVAAAAASTRPTFTG